MNNSTRCSSVKTLRAYSDFRRVFATKARFFRNGLGFCFRRAENLDFRFGISIPKHFGKAVERNKLRRRLKEIVRHCSCIPLFSEIVFCVRKPCSDFTFESLKQTCEWGFNKISHSRIPVEAKIADGL
ncbi:MAG: ribonuclease P protein component [Candidatus Riflebacteria bacterium]|nr:ribonuclease P protein component [Candidatus Riflebacteria bacterium]